MSYSSQTALLTRLTIEHGPLELMNCFFLKAIQAVNERGLSLHLATFSELERVNDSNREHWRPLFPSFSPKIGGVSDDAGFAIFALDHFGHPKVTLGSRIYDWRGTNLKAEAQSLRMMYARPELARDGETCEITAPLAETVTGRVSLGGGIWHHPDVRGLHLIELMTRINRAYAYVTYGVDQHIGFLAPAAVKIDIHHRSGFREFEDAMIMRNSTSYPGEDVSMMVLRASPADIVDDAFLFLMHWSSKGATKRD